MKSRLSKKRIVQVLLVVLVVGSAIRETRILRDIEGFEWTDLGYWGIYMSEESYTIQNLVCFWGGLVSLGLLSRRGSPKVQSRQKRKTQRRTAPNESSRKGREKSPFEMINPKWTVVLDNPRATHEEKEEP